MLPDHDRDDRAPTSVAPVPWTAFRAEMEALYSPPQVARATGGKIRQVLGIVEALGVETTADLTVTLVTRIVQSRPEGQSGYTLKGLLGTLRAMCTYAETAGYVRCSPFRLRKLSRWVRLPRLEGQRHCSRPDTRKVLDLMAREITEKTGWAAWRARRLYVMTAVVAYLGVRKMECLKLRVADVDLAAKVVHIRAPKGENLKTVASSATLPCPDALMPILIDWSNHRMDAPYGYPLPSTCEWFIPTISRKAPFISGAPGGKPLDRLKAAAKRAGVEGMTFLALRHGWATHAEYHGLGETMVQRQLRHTSVRTQKGYRHQDVENLREKTQGFDF